jgi:hypothetical protein
MQLRLIKARQGKNDVCDFQRDLEMPAVQFSDVTERKIRQIFWTGLRGYLHLHLIGNGLKPERNSIPKVVKYASRHEAARRKFKFERNNLAWRSCLNVAYFSRTNAGIERFSWRIKRMAQENQSPIMNRQRVLMLLSILRSPTYSCRWKENGWQDLECA